MTLKVNTATATVVYRLCAFSLATAELFLCEVIKLFDDFDFS